MRSKYTINRKPNPVGRPSKYNPAILSIVLKSMSEGMSKSEICLLLYEKNGVAPSTVWSWEKKFPEFQNAIKNGRTLEQGWWERIGRANITNPTFNTGLYVVQMANRFGWRRKDDIVTTVQGETKLTVKHEKEIHHVIEERTKEYLATASRLGTRASLVGRDG